MTGTPDARHTRRLALLFSDGSYTVFASGWPIDRARHEARECDANQTDPAKFTSIVRVDIARIEVVETPTLAAIAEHTGGTCPHCGAARTEGRAP